jgi:hypothetical protein
MQKLKLSFTGVAPLLMHNNLGADPRYVRKSGIKAIQNKRSKTEEEEAELLRLKYLSSLYWNGAPYLPGLNVDAALALAAGQLEKGGKKRAQSCISSEDAPLVYDGKHNTPEELFEDDKHVLTTIVTIPSNKSRVLSSRPIFPEWSATVTINYHSLTEDEIVQFATRAGDLIGLCDWRPRYGRFSVEKV